eukprot:UN32921
MNFLMMCAALLVSNVVSIKGGSSEVDVPYTSGSSTYTCTSDTVTATDSEGSQQTRSTGTCVTDFNNNFTVSYTCMDSSKLKVELCGEDDKNSCVLTEGSEESPGYESGCTEYLCGSKCCGSGEDKQLIYEEWSSFSMRGACYCDSYSTLRTREDNFTFIGTKSAIKECPKAQTYGIDTACRPMGVEGYEIQGTTQSCTNNKRKSVYWKDSDCTELFSEKEYDYSGGECIAPHPDRVDLKAGYGTEGYTFACKDDGSGYVATPCPTKDKDGEESLVSVTRRPIGTTCQENSYDGTYSKTEKIDNETLKESLYTKAGCNDSDKVEERTRKFDGTTCYKNYERNDTTGEEVETEYGRTVGLEGDKIINRNCDNPVADENSTELDSRSKLDTCVDGMKTQLSKCSGGEDDKTYKMEHYADSDCTGEPRRVDEYTVQAEGRCEAVKYEEDGEVKTRVANLSCSDNGWVESRECTGGAAGSDGNKCLNKPCGRGSCTKSDNAAGYTCTCVKGYSGDDCNTNPDNCPRGGSPCGEGGTCIDGLDDYDCECSRQRDGKRCETELQQTRKSVKKYKSTFSFAGIEVCMTEESDEFQKVKRAIAKAALAKEDAVNYTLSSCASGRRRLLNQTVEAEFAVLDGSEADTNIGDRLNDSSTMQNEMDSALEDEGVDGVDFSGNTAPTDETVEQDLYFKWVAGEWSKECATACGQSEETRTRTSTCESDGIAADSEDV